ncbi:MAG: sugar ABC transporter permease [Sphaerochaeta sp.]|jgi:ABC-type sugar transport system permease subunit|nr:sugar ABC transporter permease [Sphaerochaeta sp.]HBO35810.1 sugar ABC transporter permease [Sphaerochaeta sp.]
MVFILPALAVYAAFVTIPIFGTLRISLFTWNGASPKMNFVGLENYIRVFKDPVFYLALKNNIIWILFTIFIPVMLGLVLAIMISQKYIKGKTFFRLTYFMPQIVSLVAVGIVWGWMYNPDFGIIGRVLSLIGIPNAMDIDFLGDENLVIWSLVVAGSWTCFGFNMVVFLAALQGIDNSYLEVALLEGANALQRLRLVIVPLIKSTVTLLVLNSLIGSFKVFDLIYIMTKGGPYRSSEVIATYMFNAAFNMNEYGYASALAIVLAALVAFCTWVYMQRAEKE